MEECFICKEEKDKIQLQSFPCNTCVEGCWYICEKCKDKIIKDFDKCPVCNTSISHIKRNTDDSHIEEENHIYCQKMSKRCCKYISKCFNNCVPTMLIIFYIIINISLFLLLSFLFMLSCNTNCRSCVGLSFLFSLINQIIIILYFSGGNDCDVCQFVSGSIIFLNSIFICITSGIQEECHGTFDSNLDVIEETVVCECVFKLRLEIVWVIGIIVGCCVCQTGNNDDDE